MFEARPAPAPREQRRDQLDRRRVEVGVRLVQQQQLRIVEHGARDRHALDHAARERSQRLVGTRVHRHRLEQLVHALVLDAVQTRVEAQVLARGQLAVEQRLMAEQADARAHRPRLARQARAEHAHAAGVRTQQAREHAQQRRLAGAVGAEHDERLAFRERQRDVGESLAFAVVPSKSLDLERCHVCAL